MLIQKLNPDSKCPFVARLACRIIHTILCQEYITGEYATPIWGSITGWQNMKFRSSGELGVLIMCQYCGCKQSRAQPSVVTIVAVSLRLTTIGSRC